MIHVFRSKISLSHSPEKIHRGTPFVMCFRKIPVAKKLKEKGGVSRFSVELLCLTVPKIFVGQPFSVPLFLGIDKFYASEGKVTVFCRKFLVSRSRKFS